MRRKKTLGLLMTLVLLIFLFGCEDTLDTKKKTIPVYLGMEVKGTLDEQKAYKAPLLFSDGNDDGEDDDGVNQHNPFNKNTGDMIEDEIKNKLGIIASDDADYYTTKGEDFYIKVKISNPDEFVILSFNLNGIRYASYQFHSGSDLETIILKVNSGDVSGIKEYTIDEIKYIDGTDIKDVEIAGNQTVKVGITYDLLPSALTSNLKVESTSISLNTKIDDAEKLIELYEGPLMIYLYDGENLIKEKELVIGSNTVLFDKLIENTLYQYAIVTSYDSLDGNGSQLVILEKHAFYTNKIIDLINIDETQVSVSFDLIIDDEAEVGSLTSIGLYKGDELVESLTDLTIREFNGLLSNNEYEIKAVYTYNLGDEVGNRVVTVSKLVTTKSKTLPRYTSNLERGASSVVLNLTVEDPDSIGKLVSIELYKDNELVECLENFTEIKFTGLLSNYAYEIVVNFTYDLNEGEGEQPGAMFISFRTKFKNSPYIEIKNVVETKTSIGFELDIIDQDQVGSLTAIELYKDNELAKNLNDLTLREFSELLSNNEYEIKAIYTYDLNDGLGEQVLTATHKVTTKSKQTPLVEIKDILRTQNSIGFDFKIVDNDLVGSLTSIELYKGNELVESLEDLTFKEFTGLASNNEYEIKATYTYDLNDGQGNQASIAVASVSTLKTVPVLDVAFTHQDMNNVSYEILAEDPDLAIVLKRVYALVVVYRGWGSDPNYRETGEHELALEYSGTISDIDSGSTHQLFIEYTVNINDGEGDQDKSFTKEFKTFYQPIWYGLHSEGCITDYDSLTFHILHFNYDSVLIKELQYGFYNSDKSSLISSEFDDENQMLYPYVEDYINTYTNLLSNNEYILVISYKADLNDGLGERDFVHELSLTTAKKETPIVEIDVLETQTSIGFNLQVTDPDSVGEITSIELYRHNELIENLTDLTLREFSGLLSNNQYVIKVTHTYNLNDGAGTKTETITHEVTTKSKITPTIEIDALETQTSIGFNLQVTDPDSVGEITSIELYKNDELVESLTNLTLREFIGLLSNNVYEIRVEYSYNLNDGVGTQVIGNTCEVRTKSKVVPIVEIIDVLETQTSIGFNLQVTDPDSVGEITSIELYKNDELVENLTNLTLREFSGLLSNNLYKVKVSYTYNLNDGIGEKTLVTISEITTKSKAIPTVDIIDLVESETTISFDLEIVDLDMVGELESIKLYKGNDLVESLTDLTLREFVGLIINTLYEIRVVYSYDLNDGFGQKTLVTTYLISTLAEPIEITGLEILNTTYPQIGEEVQIRISYNNPSDLNIEGLYINNLKVNEIELESETSIIVRYIPVFEGGEYVADVTAINYMIYNQMKYHPISSTFTDTTIILADLEVLSIEGENELDYFVVETDENYIFINLENPTGYDVSSVVLTLRREGVFQTEEDFTFDSTTIQKVNNNQIKIKHGSVSDYKGYYFAIKSITYELEGVEPVTKEVNNVYNIFVGVASSEIRNISTIEDLQNMESYYIYQLTNDIDALNYNWVPYEFNGILYGNGYEVKNLSIVVDNVSEDTQYIGLFSNFNGLINQLKLVNANILANTKGRTLLGILFGRSGGTVENSYISNSKIEVIASQQALIGGFIGQLYYGNVIDSHVSGLELIVTCASPTEVGGLVGDALVTHIRNSSVRDSSISVKGEKEASVGGLCGSYSGHTYDSYVKNTTVTVNTTLNTNVGGIFGSCSGYVDNLFIDEVIIDVTKKSAVAISRIGGIVGVYLNGVLDNSYVNRSTIKVNDADMSLIGGLVGYVDVSYFGLTTNIRNSYVNETTIIVKGTGEGLACEIGGLVGENNDYISNAYTSGVTIKLESVSHNNIGGLVGLNYGNIDNSYVENLIVDATIRDVFIITYIGGLAGRNNNMDRHGTYGAIDKTYVNGATITVSSYWVSYVGGLIGFGADNSSLTNSFVNNIVIGPEDSSTYTYKIGFLGYNENSEYSNLYVSENVVITEVYQDGIPNETIAMIQFDFKTFYTDVLGWSEDVWDLDSLDCENNKFPKLKLV